MKNYLMIVMAIGLILIAGLGAEADVVFSSYPDISDNYDAWNSTSPNTEIVELFTTEAASGLWAVDLIKLNAYGGGIMGGGSSPATISIYNDNSGAVGSLVQSWNVNIDSSMGDDFSFAVSGVSLDSGANYWYGVKATGSNAVGWCRTESYGTQGAVGHVFELDGTAVPEPGSIIVLCGGILSLVGFAKRRS